MKIMLIYQSIWGSSLIVFAYLISFYFMLKRITPPTAVAISAIIISYFPPVVYIIYYGMKRINNDPWGSFGDLNSLLLMPWVFAMGLFFLFEKKRKVDAIIIIGFIILLSSWRFGRSLPEWERELDWYYRIPEETIQIGDYISEKNENSFRSNVHNTAKVLVLTTQGRQIKDDDNEIDIYINYGVGRSLRQYMSPVEVDYRSTSEIKDISNGTNTQYDYVICLKDKGILDSLYSMKYKTVKEYEKFFFLESE